MIKKLLIVIVILSAVTLLFKGQKDKKDSIKKPIPLRESLVPSAKNTSEISKSAFVPYWSLNSNDFSSYDRLFYFGVSASKDGIDREEAGYESLERFIEILNQVQDDVSFQDDRGTSKKYLTLRMLNSELNFEILENKEAQKKIIEETLQLAVDKGFDGIVLDLELFSLFDDEIKGQINSFVKDFYTAAKNQDKRLLMTIYGDIFYRRRPYDVRFLSANTDEILIMAYDFHKSRGEPGPNFPLKGKSKYGYDFETIIDDFLNITSPDKISVIFGMFGYDWTVDGKGRPLKNARAWTLNQIKSKFIHVCNFNDCKNRRDELSSETETRYKEDDRDHILWFEDEKSVEMKTKFLNEKGIFRIGYWSHGYF